MTSVEIIAEVKAVLKAAWNRPKGTVVPDVDDLVLSGNHGIELDAVVLYADMADSTALVDRYKDEFAAEVYKSFLLAACRAIRDLNGEITAFDGDRVMAIFVGGRKNSDAAKAALRINYLVKEINNAIKAQYSTMTFVLRHCVGIDSGKILAARTGIRNANDIVWVGPAANYAAKMCGIKDEGYPTVISQAVYNSLEDASKYAGSPKRDMWEQRTWSATGKTVYRSHFHWTF